MATLIYEFEETGAWNVENDTSSWASPTVSPRATLNVTKVKGKLGYDTDTARAVYGTDYPGTAENILELEFTIDTTLETWPYAYMYNWEFTIPLTNKMKCVDTAGLHQYEGSYLIATGLSKSEVEIMYGGDDTPKVTYIADGASETSNNPEYVVKTLRGLYAINQDGNEVTIAIQAAWTFGKTVFPPNATNVIVSTTGAINTYGYAYEPRVNVPGPLMRNGDQLFEFGTNAPCAQFGAFVEPIAGSNSGVSFYDLSFHPYAFAYMDGGTVYKGKWDGTFYRYWE